MEIDWSAIGSWVGGLGGLTGLASFAWTVYREIAERRAKAADLISLTRGSTLRPGAVGYRVFFNGAKDSQEYDVTIRVLTGPATIQLQDQRENSPNPGSAKIVWEAPPAGRRQNFRLKRFLGSAHGEVSEWFDVFTPSGAASKLKVTVSTWPSKTRVSSKKTWISR